MPDEATPTAVTPDAEVTPASNPAPAPAAETPQPPATTKALTLEEAMEAVDFGKMTDAQISAFESGDFSSLGLPGPSAPAAPASEDEPPATPRKAALAAATPEQLREAGESIPNRVSIASLAAEDRARTVRALELIRGGKSAAQAFAETFGITTAPAQDATETPAAPAMQPVPEVPNEVADLEGQLAVLQSKYQQAKAAYDPAATDFLEQIQDVKFDLREAKNRVASVAAQFETEQTRSHQRVLDQYSDLITSNPQFLPLCDHEISLAQKQNDPILSQPDWPENIAKRVQSKYFQREAVKNAEPKNSEAQPIPPAPSNAVRLPGSPTGPGFAAGTLSPQVAQAEVDKLTPEQEEAFIKELDRITAPPRRA